MTRKATVQAIPEVQGGASSRAVPQVIPPGRISKRIVEQIAEDSVPQVIPQKRISKRIVEQNVNEFVQVIPQERISERIVEQNVNEFVQVIPQERISERIEGRIGGNPSTLSSAAAALNSAKWLGDGDFRTFSLGKKSATTRCESSPGLGAHPSSWTSEAYAEPMAFDEDESEAKSEAEAEVEDGAVTRFAAGFRPLRVCTRFLEHQQGRPVRGCAYGDSCTFAHSWAELHPEASAWERYLASLFPE